MTNIRTIIPIEVQVAALSPAVQEVYFILKNKPMKTNDIQRKTKYSPRTIRSAIRTLLDHKLITQRIDLADLRSNYYQISG